MKALLVKTISVYTYDKKTLLLHAGEEITIDPKDGVAISNRFPNYPFDIVKSEYSILN